MLFRNFDIDPDQVTIDDQVLLRPGYISVMQWIEFWQDARDETNQYDLGYAAGYKECEEETDTEISDLQNEIDNLVIELNTAKQDYNNAYQDGYEDGSDLGNVDLE